MFFSSNSHFSGPKTGPVLSAALAISIIFGGAFVSPWVSPDGNCGLRAESLRSRVKERRQERRQKKQEKKQERKQGASTEAVGQLPPYRTWINPRFRPRVALLCVHGLGLHSGAYQFFGEKASRRGVAVYAMDVRGFGAWMNAGGKTQVDFDGCLADVKVMLSTIRAQQPNMPVFIMGESMGGAIALRAASMYPELVDGLISSVPAEERFQQKKTSVKVAMNILRPKRREFDIGSDIVNQATTDERLKQEWKGDPLDRLDLSPKELIQFQVFMNGNHKAASKLKPMPVLFVQGTKDKLVKPEGTWDLFNELASEDKVFLAVPGEHLIFEESQLQNPQVREQNMGLVSSWMLSKVIQTTVNATR